MKSCRRTDGEEIALETKKMTRCEKFAEPFRRRMPGALRGNEELCFRARGAGLCDEREELIKGGEGAKAERGTAERTGGTKSARSAGEGRTARRTPWRDLRVHPGLRLAVTVTQCRFPSETRSTWQREQWRSTSNGVALRKIELLEGRGRVLPGSLPPAAFFPESGGDHGQVYQ